MTRLHLVVLPVLVAIGLAVASPVPATDTAAPAAASTQAKYILHVDGMT
jgi:hypothetical protein